MFGKKIVHRIAVGAMLLSFGTALYAFRQMLALPAEERFLQNTLWNLLTAGRLSVDLGFALDQLSMMMVLVITGIGTLIHVFSIGYMAEEPAYWRFFSYLNLFVFAMLLLVMGDNFAVMFFGWEGVGLASYLLIAFWYTDPEKAAAGMKAFVVNRFGDFGFLAGLFLLFWALGGAWTPRGRRCAPPTTSPKAGLQATAAAANAAQSDALAPRIDGVKVGPTMNFRELRDQVVIEGTGVKEGLLHQEIWGVSLLTLIGILLFVGAMGKSAQLPLYVWLPDAMAGPTPVSALIHAATMVTAGVYMVARLNFIFALSPSAMGWVALIGALTALFAASIGFFQYDIKKVLAYSTVSQLGFMFIGVGIGVVLGRRLPPAHPRLLQGDAVPRVGLGDPRLPPRAGHAEDGRAEEAHAHHALDLPLRVHRDRRLPDRERLLLEGRDPLEGVHEPAPRAVRHADALARAGHLRHGHRRGDRHRLLHVPLVLHDLHRRVPRRRGAPRRAQRGPALGDGDGDVAHLGRGPRLGRRGPRGRPRARPRRARARRARRPGARAPHAHAGHGHGHGGHAPRTRTPTTPTPTAGTTAARRTSRPGPSPSSSPPSRSAPASPSSSASRWPGPASAPLLEHWLAPALPAQEAVPFTTIGDAHHHHQLELLFQGIGVAVAFVGWLAARALYKDAKSEVPARLKARFEGVWTVVYNKYYVDELYAAVVLKPSVWVARAFSRFDGSVIDGLVNFVGAVGRFARPARRRHRQVPRRRRGQRGGDGTIGVGRSLRTVQTGRIQTYLYGALGGALVVVLLNFLIQ